MDVVGVGVVVELPFAVLFADRGTLEGPFGEVDWKALITVKVVRPGDGVVG